MCFALDIADNGIFSRVYGEGSRHREDRRHLGRPCCTEVFGCGTRGIGVEGRPCVGPFMPFKANASRRHHIPRQRHRVRNWAEYNAGLRARGSLTIWFTPEAVERWRAATRTTPGGQRTYSDLAITTALAL